MSVFNEQTTERKIIAVCFWKIYKITQQADWQKQKTKNHYTKLLHQEGSVGKGTYHQAWWPELHRWNTKGGMRELTLASGPLSYLHTCAMVCVYSHAHNKQMY